MKALVKTERGDGHIELRDVPAPVAGPKQAVLRIAYAGICGTDVHILHDEHPYWPPVVLGHEFTGRVESVGEGVDPTMVGSRVVCEPHAGACGECHLCRRGWVQLCSQKRAPGWGVDGGFASLVAVPAYLLHRVPDVVGDRAAALCEPLAISLSALQRTPVEPGDTVVVLGPGPVGILSALASRAVGAAAVLVVGRQSSAGRLDVASRFGFRTAASPENAVEQVHEMTSGRGAGLVIDTTGSEPLLALAVSLLRRRGRLLAIGVGGREMVPFPWDQAIFKAIDIAFSFSSTYTAWDAALTLLASGAVPADAMVTEFPLEDWQSAFEAVQKRTALKAVLRPGLVTSQG
ncbi:MAG: alcohol dehydrogenase catalytic domain-containing protein [Chloroflexota bacterium]|nr:alcohol dehydrogenase catalytic domain-containing protein [Chloroflexota bacterium]